MPHPEALAHPFSPKDLQEFDPRLVTGFDPESPALPQHQVTVSLVHYGIHQAGQYEDMLVAHRHAEQEILLEIRRRKIANLIPDDVIRWLKALHERIAFTLASEFPEEQLAGHYVTSVVIRWNRASTELYFFILLLMLDEQSPETTEDLIHFLEKCGSIFRLEGADYLRFVVLCERYQGDNSQTNFNALLDLLSTSFGFKTETLFERMMTFFSYYLGLGTSEYQQHQQRAWSFLQILRGRHNFEKPAPMFMQELTDAYHDRTLSPGEREIVDEMARICIRPQDMSAAMDEFAEKLLAKWQACARDYDSNDLTPVAELAVYEFYHATDKHAFFNATGRVATCFMNVILRSLEQPSILLRNPGERDDPNSLYSRAIAAIAASDPDLDLLTQHIRTRLEEASQPRKEPDADERKAVKVVKARVKLARLFAQALEQGVDEQALNQAVEETHAQCIGNQQDVTADDILQLLVELRAMVTTNYLQPTASSAAATPGPAQSTNTAAAVAEILAKLRDLTGITDGWKVYRKGTVVLLTLGKEQHGKATKLTLQLKETRALTAKSMKHAETKQPVVQITNVHLERLRDVQVAADSAGSKAEAVDLPQPGSRTS